MRRAENLERDLVIWFAGVATPRVPDYTDDILRQTAGTHQRPRWSFPERWLPMSAITLGRQTLKPLPWRTIGLLAVLALLLSAVAAYVGSRQRLPAPFGPAANGQLVVGENGDIFLIDPATGAAALAIGGATPDSTPTFSRDGTQLAFYREIDGRQRLFVADERGQHARELAAPGITEIDWMEWAPDGQSIMIMDIATDPHAVVIVPTDGGPSRTLDAGMPVEDLVWLPPDGQGILFRTPGAVGYGLVIAPTDGTTDVRTLVPATGSAEYDALFFAPSPDGSRVAYQWRDADGIQKIFVLPVLEGTPRAISTIESILPKWSPDSSRIVFFSDAGVYMAAADGAPGQTQMLPNPGNAYRWAPDGSGVLLRQENGQLLMLDPAGGAPVETGWSAAALPDWQRLALP